MANTQRRACPKWVTSQTPDPVRFGRPASAATACGAAVVSAAVRAAQARGQPEHAETSRGPPTPGPHRNRDGRACGATGRPVPTPQRQRGPPRLRRPAPHAPARRPGRDLRACPARVGGPASGAPGPRRPATHRWPMCARTPRRSTASSTVVRTSSLASAGTLAGTGPFSPSRRVICPRNNGQLDRLDLDRLGELTDLCPGRFELPVPFGGRPTRLAGQRSQRRVGHRRSGHPWR